MPIRWVLNRHFHAGPLDANSGHWMLESADDAANGSHVQIVFLGPAAAVIQGGIDIREIRRETVGEERPRFLIDGRQGAHSVQARAMYVHETPGSQYAAAIPPQPVSLTRRWLWMLLLAVIRIPGVFALVALARRRRQ